MHPRADARPVNGRMTARRPARATREIGGVGHASDVDLARRRAGTMILRMAFQAEIAVTLDEELRIDRPVRDVTDRAALAQGFVLEHVLSGLLAMALGARLVQAGHREAKARGLHDVETVRVVALHAIHPAFAHGMMLWQVELGVLLQMAGEAGRRFRARIDDELPAPAADSDVFAARPVASFAAGLARHLRPFEMNARVRTGGEAAADVRVTLEAGLVADKGSAFDHRRRDNGALQRRAGNKRDRGQRHRRSKEQSQPAAFGPHRQQGLHGPDRRKSGGEDSSGFQRTYGQTRTMMV